MLIVQGKKHVLHPYKINGKIAPYPLIFSVLESRRYSNRFLCGWREFPEHILT